jgi:hypothetical protein
VRENERAQTEIAESSSLAGALPAPSDASFLEGPPGDLKCRHGRWPARVEGELRNRLDDLVAGNAILERLLQVERQFVGAIERDEACGRHQAAIARRETRRSQTSPNRTLLGSELKLTKH